MPLLARTLAAAALAALLALGAPLAAAADPAPYPVTKPDTWKRTITPSTLVVHTVPTGVFGAAAPLQLSVTSECPAPSLAVFDAAQLSGRLVSDGGGGAVLRLDFGASTCGVYDVTVTEPGAQNVSYGVVTVVTADPVLARTGSSIDLGVLAAAVGALALGALLWVVARVRRRGVAGGRKA
jgi:hypothetical protein